MISKILVLIGLISASVGHAETVNQSRESLSPQSSPIYRLQPAIGLSVFQTVGNVSSKVSARQALSGGLLVDFQTGFDPIDFETGGLILREGDSVLGSSFERVNTYLSLPILAKFMPRTYLNFRGGFAFAFLLSATTSTSSGTKDVMGDSNPVDLQIMVGMGTEIPLTAKNALTLNLDFIRGLANIHKSGASQVFNDGYLMTGGLIF